MQQGHEGQRPSWLSCAAQGRGASRRGAPGRGRGTCGGMQESKAAGVRAMHGGCGASLDDARRGREQGLQRDRERAAEPGARAEETQA
jgi:hypothetical protein